MTRFQCILIVFVTIKMNTILSGTKVVLLQSLKPKECSKRSKTEPLIHQPLIEGHLNSTFPGHRYYRLFQCQASESVLWREECEECEECEEETRTTASFHIITLSSASSRPPDASYGVKSHRLCFRSLAGFRYLSHARRNGSLWPRSPFGPKYNEL